MEGVDDKFVEKLVGKEAVADETIKEGNKTLLWKYRNETIPRKSSFWWVLAMEE